MRNLGHFNDVQCTVGCVEAFGLGKDDAYPTATFFLIVI